MGRAHDKRKDDALQLTGFGKDCFPPDGVLDKVFSLLSNTRQGFSVEFVGNDASKPNLLIESRIVDKRIQIITINEDERGDIPSSTVAAEDLNEPTESISLEEEVLKKSNMTRENASADHLAAKKKKTDRDNEEKEIYIAKVKIGLGPKKKFKFYKKKTM